MVGSECIYADATYPQIYKIEGLCPPPVVNFTFSQAHLALFFKVTLNWFGLFSYLGSSW